MTSPREVTVVTGGAYGIGRGIARLFAERGKAVVVADIDQERGSALQDELRAARREALFVNTDVRDEQSVRDLISRVVAEWGCLHTLVNNAGIERYRLAGDYTLHDWEDIVNTNLRSTFLCSKYALPHLIQSKGSVVNISSVQALACEPQISVYAATKAGILALTRGIARDYARQGVRVNAICPGAIMSGMQENFLATQPDRESALAAARETIPLGRIGEPEDIAKVVYFLASPEAAYITGATIVVDGGLVTKLGT